jgi:hypothetical protein
VRPVLLVGQDESTFHQFIFSKKQWKGPNGKEFLMPKSEGKIYMASGYTSREFGLGLGSLLTPHVRNEINETHRQQKTYLLTADAELIRGSSNKADFPEMYDPCLAFFRSGVQHEGYWNSSHAKLHNLKTRLMPFPQYFPSLTVSPCLTSRRVIQKYEATVFTCEK